MSETETKIFELIEENNLPAPTITGDLKFIGGSMQEGLRNMIKYFAEESHQRGFNRGYLEGKNAGFLQGKSVGAVQGILGTLTVVGIVVGINKYNEWKIKKRLEQERDAEDINKEKPCPVLKILEKIDKAKETESKQSSDLVKEVA